MLDDKTQAVRDLEMYAEHMSRAILGKKAENLRPWISPKTLDALPIRKKALPIRSVEDVDILSYVETTVSRIEEISETSNSFLEDPPDALESSNVRPKE